MERQLSTLEENQKRYNQMTEQPLICALKSRTPEIALELLERGADPNVITSLSHQYMNYTWQPRFTGESALDIVYRHLNVLQQYKGEEQVPSRPTLPEGIDIYLNHFEEGSYQQWVVSKEIDKLRETHRRALEKYEKDVSSPNSTPGLQEKAAMIEEATKTMVEIKETMVAMGAKRFAELYPEYLHRLEIPNHRNENSFGRVEKSPEPYKFNFCVKNVNDVTEARKKAYLRL
jgi:hypothetical protein